VKSGLINKILLGIFVLALFLRLLAVINQEASEIMPRSDAKEYDKIAINMASGYGYSLYRDGKYVPTMHFLPGYPLFLATIYRFFGHDYMAAKVMQAIIGALFCIIIFFIGRAIYGDYTGITAAFIAAIYKPFACGLLFSCYGGPAYLLSEYLTMFFISLSILLFILFLKKKDKILAVMTGILIGMTVSTRPEFIIFPVLFFLYFLYASRFAISAVIKKYFLIYLFIGLTLAPWIIRNYIIERKFIPFSTYSGIVFWVGNNSLAKGGWVWPEDYQKTIDKIKGFSEYQENKIFFTKGLEWVKHNPKKMPWLIIKRLLIHWAPFENGLKVFNVYYAFVLLFAAIGILFFRNRSVSEVSLVVALLTTSATAAIFYGDPRYRYPYEFCLIIFAALAIVKIFGIIGRKAAYGTNCAK
jgi:4-amino-4-deoxy-L-arabinose transferase-like glycosyltransferase